MRFFKVALMVAVAAGSFMLTSPASASRIPASCSFLAHSAVFSSSPAYSRVWLTNVSGCASGYPIFYNQTGCGYPPRTGEYWYNGPTRKGNGSISSNYSLVTCNQYAHGVVVDVWGWVNGGVGWKGFHLYHL